VTTSRETSHTPAVFALTEGGIATALRAVRITGGFLWVPDSRKPHLPGAIGRPGPDGGPSAADPEVTLGTPVQTFDHLGPALRGAFAAGNPCVCILAAGIVLRLLAPVISDKQTDPAVVVLDEAGCFAIPVLSGHQGGANSLARLLARELGGQVVITTSSDVQGLVAPDVLARRINAKVLSPQLLTPVASALANGEKPELWFDPGEMGNVSAYLEALPGFRPHRVDLRSALRPEWSNAGAGRPSTPVLAVTTYTLGSADSGSAILQLVPRWVTAGVGCRRGRSGAAIEEAVRWALTEEGLHPACLAGIATAEAKRDEPGLQEAAAELDVPLWISENDDLEREIAAHGLTVETFVASHVGVGAVCEPAALWGAGPGSVLVAEKRSVDGITVALAQADGAAVLTDTEEDECPS